MYSCYVILNENRFDTRFILEGIEDIDLINERDGYNKELHIQLKHSGQRQDASFMKSILKNFLEVYLFDRKRQFKLVYDFSTTLGKFSKLINGNLSVKDLNYWEDICDNIKLDNSTWNWEEFSFEKFIEMLSFEKVTKEELCDLIEYKLIEKYNITTENLSIYMNAIKIFCLDKMTCRGEISKKDLDDLIEVVKDDISKGYQNPAHYWINKIIN